MHGFSKWNKIPTRSRRCWLNCNLTSYQHRMFFGPAIGYKSQLKRRTSISFQAIIPTPCGLPLGNGWLAKFDCQLPIIA